MEKFLGRFTLTDFFGIFLPGSIFTLSAQYYFLFVLPPFEAFFGVNSPWRPVYFVLISYAFGVLLQEIGYHLREVLGTRDREVIPEAYRITIEAKYRTSVAQLDTPENDRLTPRMIYRFVRSLPDIEQGRLPMMAALFSMCRNGSCSAFSVSVLTIVKIVLAGHSSERIATAILAFATGLLLWIRADRFREYVYDNACICFLKWTPENIRDLNAEESE